MGVVKSEVRIFNNTSVSTVTVIILATLCQILLCWSVGNVRHPPDFKRVSRDPSKPSMQEPMDAVLRNSHVQAS